MERFKFPEDEPIEHPLITRSIEIAQKRVEAHNFEIRKDLLKFDDVMNKQREVIYKQRRIFLEKEDVEEEIWQIIDEVIEEKIKNFYATSDFEGLNSWLKKTFNINLDKEFSAYINAEEIKKEVKEKDSFLYQELEKKLGRETLSAMEKSLALWVIDHHWKEHLLALDYLKEGIHLRGYASRDPIVEYQRESFFLFEEMVASAKEEIVNLIFHIEVTPKEFYSVFEAVPKSYVHSEYSSLEKKEKKTPVVKGKKIGRNDPCPCGSGKKYKKCCGRFQ